MTKTAPLAIQRSYRRQLAVLLVMAVALYVILPQLAHLHGQLPSLSSLKLDDVWLAVIAVGGTYLFGGATYCLLAFKPLGYGSTVLVQLAATFVNRLLPAGLGNLGVNFVYLRRRSHNRAQAASVVAVNNALGMAGHACLLVLAVMLWPAGLNLSALTIHWQSWWWLAAAAAGLLIIWLWRHYRRPLRRNWTAFKKQILTYRQRRSLLAAAILTSMSLTVCNWLALWLCLRAFNLNLDPLRVFVVLSLGIAAGTATPTPGGLGGAEAGLLAGLLAMKAAYAPALAAVLLYRLVYYWLAMLTGGLAFALARRLGYLSLKY